ncbi:ABC transporter substrate-binding protein [Lederbergia sp. NSJ-179]|uniref:ABC transporter substrate-binding protein n=1 Tax=Lederbergia sp. NSJ-179 TaxID=2931402 RepID=UPI001FD013EA|nr:ABC transporter substrate-binding protein [Lederbergia sp. NSJ-179]MCJ7840856.1 ABC transporter substrate-binding protein [Lederbergia sp. NSJ-179]
MKQSKITIFISMILLSLIIAACSSGETSKDDPNKSTDSEKNANTTSVVEDTQIAAEDPSASPLLAVNRGNMVVVGLQEPGGIFTPYFNSSGYDGNVQSVMFPPLVDINEAGEPIPGLAKDWDVSDDGLTYTFHLRDDLKFDDGTPLTAEDVEFTLTLLHDPSYGGGTDITEAKVVGGLDYKNGDADTISGIQVIDEKTIEIKTEEVNARSLRLLGGQVLKKDYYGKDYKKGNLDYLNALHLKPVGAGPFRFVDYLPGQEIRYEANEYFYDGKPEVDQFIYKTTEGDSQQFFQTGELDYSSLAANQDNFEFLQALGFANINVYTSSAYGYITFNHEKEIFKDPKVRQAFIYGLDRQTIIDTYYQGYAQVANVPVSPTSWAYTDEIGSTAYDPEKAKQLLEEAGWTEGANGIREKDGKKLVVYYFTSAGGLGDTLIPIAKENYKEIGIDLQVEQMDFNALLSRVENGDHDLASFSTTMLTDPYNGIDSFHTKTKDSIIKGYGNEKIDALIDATIATNDQDERTAAFHELYKALDEDPPVILMSYTKVLSGTNARVKGFEPNGYRGIAPSLKNLQVVDVQQ